MSSCQEGISQTVASFCCPQFFPDGRILLTDASGSTATIDALGNVVINMTGASADFGNILTNGSDGLPFLELTSLPVGISADVGQLLTLGMDNLPFLNAAAIPVQGISTALGNRLTTGPDGLPFLSTDNIKAAETVTVLNYNTSTRQLSYNNEAGAIATFDLSGLTRGAISADTGNLLLLGSDQQPFFSLQQLAGLEMFKLTSGAASSTVLNGPHSMLWGNRLHFFSNGSMDFTAIANAAGGPGVQGEVRLSGDAGNGLSFGNDGGLFFNTGLIPTTGISSGSGNLLSLGLDGLPILTENDLPLGVSKQAGNILIDGSDRKPYLSESIIKSNETVTTLQQNATNPGIYQYTNETGVVSNIDTLDGVSADTGNILVLGADNRPYLSSNSTVLQVTSGPNATTVAGGPIDLSWGDRLHFYSGGSISFGVSAGSVNTLVDVSLSSDLGNLLTFGTDGGVSLPAAAVSTAVSTAGIISADAGNLLTTGSDNLALLAGGGLLSNDQGNLLTTGADGKLTLPPTAIPATGISRNAGNDLSLGSDQLPFFEESLTSLTYGSGVLSYTNELGQIARFNIPAENFLSAASFNDATGVLTMTLLDGTTVPVNLARLMPTLPPGTNFNQLHDPVTLALGESNLQLTGQQLSLNLTNLANALNSAPGTGGTLHNPVTILPADSLVLAINANQQLSIDVDAIARELNNGAAPQSNATVHPALSLDPSNINGLTLNAATQVLGFSPPAATPLHSPVTISNTNNGGGALTIAGQELSLNIAALQTAVGMPTIISANANNLLVPGTDGGAFLAASAIPLSHNPVSISSTAGNGLSVDGNQVLSFNPPSATPLHRPVTVSPTTGNGLAVDANQVLSLTLSAPAVPYAVPTQNGFAGGTDNVAEALTDLDGRVRGITAGGVAHNPVTISPTAGNGLGVDGNQVLSFTPPAATPLHPPVTIANSGNNALTLSGQALSLNINALQAAVGTPTIVSTNANNLIGTGSDGGAFLPAAAIPPSHNPVTINTLGSPGLVIDNNQVLTFVPPAATPLHPPVTIHPTNNSGGAITIDGNQVISLSLPGQIAPNVSYVVPTPASGFAAGTDNVKEALDDLDGRVRSISAGGVAHNPVTISPGNANGLSITAGQALSFNPPAATPLHAPVTIANSGGGLLSIAGQALSLGQVSAPAVGYTVPATNGFAAGTDQVAEALNDLDSRVRGISAGGVAHNPVTLAAQLQAIGFSISASQALDVNPSTLGTALGTHPPVTISATSGNGLAVDVNQVLSYTPPAATPLHAPVTIANSGGGALTLSGQALSLNLPADSPMIGASAAAAGTQGDVPAPPAGAQNRFLRGDGTWADVSSPSIYHIELGQGGDHFVDGPIDEQHAHVIIPPGIGVNPEIVGGTYFVGGNVDLELDIEGGKVNFNGLTGAGVLSIPTPIQVTSATARIRERVTAVNGAGKNVVIGLWIRYTPQI